MMHRLAIAAMVSASMSLSRANLPDKACSLLTDAEITAAVGAPSGSHDSQMPMTQGPAKGETTKLCTWTVPNGAVNLAFVKVADLDAGRSAFRAQMEKTTGALKKQAWTIDEKSFGGDIRCWTGTPPANAKDTPRYTGCAGATNGVGISVGTAGSTAVDAETVKKLLDAAMRRLG